MSLVKLTNEILHDLDLFLAPSHQQGDKIWAKTGEYEIVHQPVTGRGDNGHLTLSRIIQGEKGIVSFDKGELRVIVTYPLLWTEQLELGRSDDEYIIQAQTNLERLAKANRVGENKLLNSRTPLPKDYTNDQAKTFMYHFLHIDAPSR
jgi:hypothetical protein